MEYALHPLTHPSHDNGIHPLKLGTRFKCLCEFSKPRVNILLRHRFQVQFDIVVALIIELIHHFLKQLFFLAKVFYVLFLLLVELVKSACKVGDLFCVVSYKFQCLIGNLLYPFNMLNNRAKGVDKKV